MNDNEQSNPMLARIRALLAKAEDTAASAEEAKAYFAKAAELMAKYGIERAMLADSDPALDRPGDRVIVVEGNYANDRIYLLGYIADVLNCHGITKDKSRGKAEVHLFGYESDLDRVELLFTSLLLQMFNGMRQGRPAPGESTITYRKSWVAGFILTVHKRLQEIEARARQEAPASASGRSAELVVADRKAVTMARFNAAYPDSRKGGGTRRRGTGLKAGQEAGRRADLGQTRVGQRRRALSV
ncbi:hypothetical protein GCM10010211_48680 [Streptomyces albospinus]|uniref:Uncharacterized protein n=2 Tax=Streptomyces TaxID=1883 RepID=A0A101PBP8_9ACTN|nr:MULTISPECIES: DUF2786 domain-containing protein [Streptomyces]KUN08605.1 hypothetical protein AQI95_09645 [Streptomyces yokosukanensis]GGU77037.1 hypothetical protein GCM10010211_48680 [Streptomyces albospinus]